MSQLQASFGVINWVEIRFPELSCPVGQGLDKRHQAKAAFLRQSFLGRNACIITAEPQNWSILDDLFEPPVLKINKGRTLYHVGFSSCLSAPMIEEILSCPDFDLGSLWITSILVGETNRVESLISTVHNRGMNPPFTTETMIMSERDGAILYLMNPVLERGAINALLQKYCRFYLVTFAW